MLSPSLIYTLIAVVFILIFVFLIFILMQIKSSGKFRKLSYPVYDYTIKRAQERAQKILNEAKEQARGLLVEAELSSVKMISDGKIDSARIKDQYKKHLDQLAKETESSFLRYIKRAEEIHDESVNYLKVQVEKNKDLSERKMGEVLDAATLALKDFKDRSVKKIDVSIANEMDILRQTIEEHKKQREAFIEDNIVSLVEKTASLVVQKELNLSEHSDVVLSSLELAKKEKVF